MYTLQRTRILSYRNKDRQVQKVRAWHVIKFVVTTEKAHNTGNMNKFRTHIIIPIIINWRRAIAIQIDSVGL